MPRKFQAGMAVKELPPFSRKFLPLGDLHEAILTDGDESTMLHHCQKCKAWVYGHPIKTLVSEDGFEGISYECGRCSFQIVFMEAAEWKAMVDAASAAVKSLPWPKSPVDPAEEAAKKAKADRERRRSYSEGRDYKAGW